MIRTVATVATVARVLLGRCLTVPQHIREGINTSPMTNCFVMLQRFNGCNGSEHTYSSVGLSMDAHDELQCRRLDRSQTSTTCQQFWVFGRMEMITLLIVE